MDPSGVERETQRIGREILNRIPRDGGLFFGGEGWQGKVLRLCMANEPLRIALFRFVDVLPNLKTSADVVRLFREYLDRPEIGSVPLLSWGMKALVPGSPVSGLAAAAIRSNVEAMARHFIAGRDLPSAEPELKRLERDGAAWSVSILGETAVHEGESAAYQARYLEALDHLSNRVPGRETGSDRFGRIPSANLAVKLSSLYSQMDPLDWEGSLSALVERLSALIKRAAERGAHLHLDMEHYAFKDLILEAFFRAMKQAEPSGFRDVGVVIQAYLRDSAGDLERVLDWARKNRPGITVRLVRGAYWDTETVVHRRNGWPVPVFLGKGETDERYERLTDRLLSSADTVRAAFGTHNIRSLAHAAASARALGLADREYEIQMLYGMAGPLQAGLTEMGLRVRIYTPLGELIPGMAYLVRRLLENTSNESFLRGYFVDEKSPDSILHPPDPSPVEEAVRSGFQNEPPLNFIEAPVRERFSEAMESVRKQLGRDLPLIIGRAQVKTSDTLVSVNPARPSQTVGRSSCAGIPEADRALARAGEAAQEWSARGFEERAAVLRKAADRLAAKRYELSAWELFEAGKSRREADLDVAEAIDFLRYYAQETERLGRPRRLGRYPGEQNIRHYLPIGVGAVISPWNFPLAIPAGMVSAALAAGNAVVFKPSEWSPAMGFHLVTALMEAGLPEGVLSFLPGRGEVVGDYLVRHPAVGFIAFTGSREVGLGIIEAAARVDPKRRLVKRVVAEMGGKNAIIVDETADLDQAVPGVLHSAVGYQGQKCSACSRVIVTEPVYDAFLERLSGALASLRLGPPEDPGSRVGPVIEASAVERLRSAVEAGRREGRVVFETGGLPREGFFVGPVLIADLPPDSQLIREELFGPVLAVIRAADLSDAIRIANDTDYALTGGLYSRSPAAIDRVSRELACGNLYINRPITGAKVGRQPFGGYRLSGAGTQAGGPDYLLQFMIPRVVTENTLRRGFAPADEECPEKD